MSGESLLLFRRDLEFMLYEWLDVESLTAAPRFAEHSRETFDAVLDTFERIAVDLFEPHYQKSDREEPQFVDGRAKLIPEIAIACGDSRSAFHESKRNACRFFFIYELPRVDPQLSLLEKLDRLSLDTIEGLL